MPGLLAERILHTYPQTAPFASPHNPNNIKPCREMSLTNHRRRTHKASRGAFSRQETRSGSGESCNPTHNSVTLTHMRKPKTVEQHRCSPKEYRKVPALTGDYDFDRAIMRNSNRDMADRLQTHTTSKHRGGYK